MTSSVSKPTLTYFNISALGEVTRVLLEDAGVDYDFVPVTNWAQNKPQFTATGTFPMNWFCVPTN
jgi:glutathione S-transferase